MKVLITGGGGQLGKALARTRPVRHVHMHILSHKQLDITDALGVERIVQETRPDVVINAAAFTDVDRAEKESARAYAVNAKGVQNLAKSCKKIEARLVTVSTDFVFDGQKSSPYLPNDEPNPLNIYGSSKLAGERKAGKEALIIRTAWLYAAEGRNFVYTILRLAAEKDEIRVVSDQVGTPTYAKWLAEAIWKLIEKEATGLWHFTDSGVASWYDFAVAVLEEAKRLGVLTRPVKIVPIRSHEYPTPAKRPSYSVLEKAATWAKLGWYAPHWRESLREMLEEVKAHG